MNEALQSILNYGRAGGFLMIPIAASAVAIWVLYVNELANAKFGSASQARKSLENRISILAVLVAVAPLLGLLGTVVGMVDTFNAIAAHATANSSALAQGISKALITTQAGLAAAIPGTLALAHLHAIARKK
ncbi:MAG TPA: MotA/TolQ/ExbB proton channel family protein [Lentisphaeria bacterium]|mgnify:CR=1 FL=1|nr:MotA/TolQ/ExbB proton channel family protein [Lentisphaerota bacterium]OQC14237.1 MAG: Biopolymer transport protein ExbB [Lentisphaerae bacterium ADurb.Bin082]HPY89975.1 MotA/TolQ/ExbB proton channel family protein [Lentisphaeria bacterium]HQC53059.1 MotA/TolQ/ExbB proton channel family protein [Lentisphaeria bacterium]HQL87248.1 MotA/TolQ/ExbB proton channel family protein [Lentisphaeria bacterium]